jgi:S1-C subfamily serine protease
LVENDIILEIDGTKIDENISLANIIAGKKVGDTVKLKVLHKGEKKNVEVKLEEIPA